MQGKIHPYWYIPSSTFPCIHIINICGITNPDPDVFSTLQYNIVVSVNGSINQPYISVSNSNFNATEDVSILFTFNTKISEFDLIEIIKVSTESGTQPIFCRLNNIKCYFSDDFDTVEILTPSDNSLALSDLNNLYTVEYQGTGIDTESMRFMSDGFIYIGRRFRSNETYIYEVNPHMLAENKNVSDYDYALIKFIQWNNIQGTLQSTDSMAIISNYSYYPMGNINSDHEYWILLRKAVNERLYFVREGGYYGVGIREIRYLKLF